MSARWLLAALLAVLLVLAGAPREAYLATVIIELPVVASEDHGPAATSDGSPVTSDNMLTAGRLALIDLDASRRPHWVAWRRANEASAATLSLETCAADGTGRQSRPLGAVPGPAVASAGAYAVSPSGQRSWLAIPVARPWLTRDQSDRLLLLASDGQVLRHWTAPAGSFDAVHAMRAVDETGVCLYGGGCVLRYDADRAEPRRHEDDVDLVDSAGWAWRLLWYDQGRPRVVGTLPGTGQHAEFACPAAREVGPARLVSCDAGGAVVVALATRERRLAAVRWSGREVRLLRGSDSQTLLRSARLHGPWRARPDYGAVLATDADGTVWVEAQEYRSGGRYYLLRARPNRRSLLTPWLRTTPSR